MGKLLLAVLLFSLVGCATYHVWNFENTSPTFQEDKNKCTDQADDIAYQVSQQYQHRKFGNALQTKVKGCGVMVAGVKRHTFDDEYYKCMKAKGYRLQK